MRALAFLALALCVASCDSPPAMPAAAGPLTLSEWHLFEDMSHQIPASDVVPYEVIAPLFSDYATKHRFLRVPEGEHITIDANGDLQFPDESVIVKTFGFLADLRDPTSAERLIETRLLVRADGRWNPLIYRYDADGHEARLSQYGATVPVEWDDATGHRAIDYRVPDAVTCSHCHAGVDPMHLLGVRARQMDRDHDYGGTIGVQNQLARLHELGLLETLPTTPDPHLLVDPFGSAPLEARARSYMEANCAHCHRRNGASDQSGLLLGIEMTDPLRLGICKGPAAAGPGGGMRPFDITPGHPDDSIVVFRVESDIPGIKMPELPTVLSHTEGAALLREWIQAMPPDDCRGGDAGTTGDASM